MHEERITFAAAEHIVEKRTWQKPSAFFWQGQKDLNPRHSVLETDALPTELYPYLSAREISFDLVDRQGLEPRTDRL